MTVLWIILGALALLIAVLLVRAAMFKPREAAEEKAPPLGMDEEHIVESLARMVRCRTVSSRDNPEAVDQSQFEAFHRLLEERYPLVHRTCTREFVGKNGILYHWKGKTPGDPTVLMAHYDVVPVVEAEWEKPPFSGILEDGVLWGRGTLDTKGTLCGAMEGAEYLLAKGFQPEHDIYFSFGGDEEVAGSAVVDQVFPGVSEPCALIGVGEKGMADISLRCVSRGGHASTPPKHGPLGKLAQAIVNIENHPMKATLPPPTREMLDTLGRHSSFAMRLLFANMWLFSGLVKLAFTGNGGELNAMCRTTTAFTMASGSKQSNVLPAEARAVVNCRLSRTDTVDSVLAHLRRQAGEDVEVELIHGMNASPYSSTGSEGWKKLKRAINQTFPDAIVSPYVMLACSDSRHFCQISDNVLRFSFMYLTKEERGLIHAANERIPARKMVQCAECYTRLMEQL